MNLPFKGLLLLGGVALLLTVGVSGSSSSSHSMRYFSMAMSEPSQELPQFISVSYVDDQLFTHYDSHTRRRVPVAPWMEKIGKEDPQYWERNTQRARSSESAFRASLETLRGRYNQSRAGLHTLQWMYGCEVGPDGQLRGGHWQVAYDGEDFIALDKETVTWTAPVPQALPTKSKWEKTHDAQFRKSYLEEECVAYLQMHLKNGRESLLRTERPMVRVTRKEGYDGQETLFCQLYGFYPKEIEVTWMKDGEDQKPETFSGGVVPNSDGTYHTWLSIEVDPKEKDRYRCWVGHDSLEEPLDLAWEEPASYSGLILGMVVGILGCVLFVGILVGVILLLKRWIDNGYRLAPPISV